jgi:hypothetical protein
VASFLETLKAAYPPAAAQPGAIVAAAADDARNKQIEIVEMTQYALYVAFQLLVLALASAVAVALIVAIWRLIAHPDTSQAILSGVVALGAIVTGTAAGFLQKQANVAKGRYEDCKNYRTSKA